LYKLDQIYDYHSGADGYNIENFHAFKDKLLQLIKEGWITFEKALNVNVNSFPNHAFRIRVVNAIRNEKKQVK
jgi:hypothetical protein